MVKNVHVELTEDEYERLLSVKNEHGLTWRGMLVLAADELEND